jgi:hypothetical protein
MMDGLLMDLSVTEILPSVLQIYFRPHASTTNQVFLRTVPHATRISGDNKFLTVNLVVACRQDPSSSNSHCPVFEFSSTKKVIVTVDRGDDQDFPRPVRLKKNGSCPSRRLIAAESIHFLPQNPPGFISRIVIKSVGIRAQEQVGHPGLPGPEISTATESCVVCMANSSSSRHGFMKQTAAT